MAMAASNPQRTRGELQDTSVQRKYAESQRRTTEESAKFKLKEYNIDPQKLSTRILDQRNTAAMARLRKVHAAIEKAKVQDKDRSLEATAPGTPLPKRIYEGVAEAAGVAFATLSTSYARVSTAVVYVLDEVMADPSVSKEDVHLMHLSPEEREVAKMVARHIAVKKRQEGLQAGVRQAQDPKFASLSRKQSATNIEGRRQLHRRGLSAQEVKMMTVFLLGLALAASLPTVGAAPVPRDTPPDPGRVPAGGGGAAALGGGLGGAEINATATAAAPADPPRVPSGNGTFPGNGTAHTGAFHPSHVTRVGVPGNGTPVRPAAQEARQSPDTPTPSPVPRPIETGRPVERRDLGGDDASGYERIDDGFFGKDPFGPGVNATWVPDAQGGGYTRGNNVTVEQIETYTVINPQGALSRVNAVINGIPSEALFGTGFRDYLSVHNATLGLGPDGASFLQAVLVNPLDSSGSNTDILIKGVSDVLTERNATEPEIARVTTAVLDLAARYGGYTPLPPITSMTAASPIDIEGITQKTIGTDIPLSVRLGNGETVPLKSACDRLLDLKATMKSSVAVNGEQLSTEARNLINRIADNINPEASNGNTDQIWAAVRQTMRGDGPKVAQEQTAVFVFIVTNMLGINGDAVIAPPKAGTVINIGVTATGGLPASQGGTIQVAANGTFQFSEDSSVPPLVRTAIEGSYASQKGAPAQEVTVVNSDGYSTKYTVQIAPAGDIAITETPLACTTRVAGVDVSHTQPQTDPETGLETMNVYVPVPGEALKPAAVTFNATQCNPAADSWVCTSGSMTVAVSPSGVTINGTQAEQIGSSDSFMVTIGGHRYVLDPNKCTATLSDEPATPGVEESGKSATITGSVVGAVTAALALALLAIGVRRHMHKRAHKFRRPHILASDSAHLAYMTTGTLEAVRAALLIQPGKFPRNITVVEDSAFSSMELDGRRKTFTANIDGIDIKFLQGRSHTYIDTTSAEGYLDTRHTHHRTTHVDDGRSEVSTESAETVATAFRFLDVLTQTRASERAVARLERLGGKTSPGEAVEFGIYTFSGDNYGEADLQVVDRLLVACLNETGIAPTLTTEGSMDERLRNREVLMNELIAKMGMPQIAVRVAMTAANNDFKKFLTHVSELIQTRKIECKEVFEFVSEWYVSDTDGGSPSVSAEEPLLVTRVRGIEALLARLLPGTIQQGGHMEASLGPLLVKLRVLEESLKETPPPGEINFSKGKQCCTILERFKELADHIKAQNGGSAKESLAFLIQTSKGRARLPFRTADRRPDQGAGRDRLHTPIHPRGVLALDDERSSSIDVDATAATAIATAAATPARPSIGRDDDEDTDAAAATTDATFMADGSIYDRGVPDPMYALRKPLSERTYDLGTVRSETGSPPVVARHDSTYAKVVDAWGDAHPAAGKKTARVSFDDQRSPSPIPRDDAAAAAAGDDRDYLDMNGDDEPVLLETTRTLRRSATAAPPSTDRDSVARDVAAFRTLYKVPTDLDTQWDRLL